MMTKKGFSIVEIMIVLIIISVIMLIVFVAVPQLFRSRNNNQRTKEATVIAAAVHECMTNKNFIFASCDITALTAPESYIDITTFNRLTSLSVEAPGSTVTDTASAFIIYERSCNTTADDIDPTPKARTFSILWMNEVADENDGIKRCLSS